MSLLNILAQDKDIITYRKELNVITGSVTATILLQQLIYWDNKNDHKPFYKFIEPCNNEKYTDGDSWTEELGFSKYEFTTAYKKLESLGIVSKKKNMMNVTFYALNSTVLAKLIMSIYGSEENQSTEVKNTDFDYSKSLTTETTTETTTDIIKTKAKKDETITLPENLDAELWNDFLELRKKLKAPNTHRALAGLAKKLFDLQAKGYDCNEIVQTAYENGWKSFYEPKQQQANKQYKPYNTPTMQTLNTDVNVWDMVEECEMASQHQGVING